MNSKDYISSGSVETHAIGANSMEEKVLFGQRVLASEEVKSELEATEDCLDFLSYKLSITPREELKRAIVDSASAPAPTKVRSLTNWRLLSGIAASVCLILAFVSFSTWNRYQSVAKQNQSLLAEKELLANNLTKVKNQLNLFGSRIDVLRDPSNQIIQLAGTENAPGATLNVIINSKKKEVFIDALNLPPIAEDKQFQLWAIVGGQPVDMGVFDSQAMLLEMSWVEQAATFAVTIEPSGGSITPSLETMVVIGNLI